jgi:hypothetical protein
MKTLFLFLIVVANAAAQELTPDVRTKSVSSTGAGKRAITHEDVWLMKRTGEVPEIPFASQGELSCLIESPQRRVRRGPGRWQTVSAFYTDGSSPVPRTSTPPPARPLAHVTRKDSDPAR